MKAFSRSLKRIFAIADKEWIQIRRDSRSLILSLLAPALLILLFGYALTMDVTNFKAGFLKKGISASDNLPYVSGEVIS